MADDSYPRKHPDIFTAEEAADYLHLEAEAGERTLETLRANHGLVGHYVGKKYMYHRKNLNACVERIFGVAPGARQ